MTGIAFIAALLPGETLRKVSIEFSHWELDKNVAEQPLFCWNITSELNWPPPLYFSLDAFIIFGADYVWE